MRRLRKKIKCSSMLLINFQLISQKHYFFQKAYCKNAFLHCKNLIALVPAAGSSSLSLSLCSQFFLLIRTMWVVSCREVVYSRERKHYFLLIMYGFCSSNALYSASLLFRMFIFVLTPFDI